MPDINIVISGDKSHTLYVPSIDEHYHSIYGAINESMHIFINAGFNFIRKKEIRILEVGFGTGLNAFLTLIEAQEQNIKTFYYTVEKYPLDINTVKKLNYTEFANKKFSAQFENIHLAEWNSEEKLSDNFSLIKYKQDICNLELQEKYDLIYFDAFAPEKQPEMWTKNIFSMLYRCTKNRGVLTTYCAKGVVNRTLMACGFSTEKIPGPPGKREMIRAVKKN